MYKAVILDLDGTLLDTFQDLGDSVNFALEQMGYPKRTKEEIRKFIGNGVVTLMSRAVPSETSEENKAVALDIFREHYLKNMNNSTKAYDGIDEMLEVLRRDNISTAVVSNKLHEAVVELCEKFFGDRINVALGVSNEDERKPKPFNVYRAVEEMGVGLEEVIYVGDSEVDVETAHNAGVRCIGVTWGSRDVEELVESGADFIVHDVENVLRIIKE